MNTNTDLMSRMTIVELVREWDLATHEIKRGLEMLRGAEERLNRAFAGPGSYYDLNLFNHNDCSMDYDSKRLRLRGAAWRYLVDRAEIKKVASIKRAQEIDKMLEKPDKLPEITVDNLFGFIESLQDKAVEMMEEAAREVFDMLRPPNYRGYKTNNPFKVGKKVILTYAVEKEWSGTKFRTCYRYENDLRALNNVFSMLAGQGLSKTRNGELCDAIRESPDGVGETEFFRFRCHKNQNLHLEFRRPDLVARLNEIGGRGLPCDSSAA